MGVLVIRILLFRVLLGSPIFGNSHMGFLSFRGRGRSLKFVQPSASLADAVRRASGVLLKGSWDLVT